MAGPIDELLSTTLKNWVEDNAIDNIFKTHALFFELQRRKAIKGVGGGERMVAPLEYATNATVAAIGKAGKIPLTEQDVISSAEYLWKLYAGAVVLFEYDLRRNRNEWMMVNLVETKARNAVKTMQEQLLTDTFAASQSALGVLNWLSIFINTGIVGGVDPSVFTWWQAKYDSTAKPLTIEDMFDMYNQASGGSDPPQVIVTNRTLYQKYNSLLQASQRFTDPELAGAGFETLKFHAANMIWDEQMSADVLFWNVKYLYLGVLPEHVDRFEVDPFMQIPDQIGKASRVWFMGNWVVTNRRRLGRLAARTT